jgi:hypothetical protein
MANYDELKELLLSAILKDEQSAKKEWLEFFTE